MTSTTSRSSPGYSARTTLSSNLRLWCVPVLLLSSSSRTDPQTTLKPVWISEYGFSAECRVLPSIQYPRAISLSLPPPPPSSALLHLGDIDDAVIFALPSIPAAESVQVLQIAGVARAICKDSNSDFSFVQWAQDVLNTPVGGHPGIDDKRFVFITSTNGSMDVHRFERGQRVLNFSTPIDCRMLFESQSTSSFHPDD